jgi:hypothetical protein
LDLDLAFDARELSHRVPAEFPCIDTGNEQGEARDESRDE